MTAQAIRTHPLVGPSFVLIIGLFLIILASLVAGGGRQLLEAVGLSFDVAQNAMYVLHVGLFYVLLGLLIERGRALDSAERSFTAVGLSLVVVFIISVGVMFVVHSFLFPSSYQASYGHLILERVLMFTFIAPAMLGLPLGVASRTGDKTAITGSVLLFPLLPFAGFLAGLVVLNWSGLAIILVGIAFAIDIVAAIPLFLIGRLGLG